MRTTLTLDDNVLRDAREWARQRSITLGEAISDLARQSLERGARMNLSADIPHFIVPPDAPVITLEDVKSAEDED